VGSVQADRVLVPVRAVRTVVLGLVEHTVVLEPAARTVVLGLVVSRARLRVELHRNSHPVAVGHMLLVRPLAQMRPSSCWRA